MRARLVTVAVVLGLAAVGGAARGDDPGAAAVVDAGTQSVDFTDEGGPALGGDEVTARSGEPVQFDDIIPDKYKVPEGTAETSPPAQPKKRGTCASCVAAGEGGGGAGAWGVTLIAVLGVMLGKIGRRGRFSGNKEKPHELDVSDGSRGAVAGSRGVAGRLRRRRR